jgi:hypothetical protein
VGRRFYLIHESYLRNVAASGNAETQCIKAALFRVIRLKKLAEAVRLHAHDIVDAPIEVGAASEHLDSDDRFFYLVGVTFSPFGDNIIQKMAKVGSFSKGFRF